MLLLGASAKRSFSSWSRENLRFHRGENGGGKKKKKDVSRHSSGEKTLKQELNVIQIFKDRWASRKIRWWIITWFDPAPGFCSVSLVICEYFGGGEPRCELHPLQAPSEQTLRKGRESGRPPRRGSPASAQPPARSRATGVRRGWKHGLHSSAERGRSACLDRVGVHHPAT